LFTIKTSIFDSSPVTHNSATKYITIQHGSSSNNILNVLEEHDILKEPLATKIYLRFINKNAKMEAGDYKFPSPISPVAIIKELEHGRKRTKTMTIPEGWTRFEIAKRIAKEFPVVPVVTEKEILEMMNDT